jgi:hypothetical protein
MPMSTKLTLLVLVLPVLLIISVFLAGFCFYRESSDASAFSTAVSSLLSAILVILLVWERLRDSLHKKLEYLHKSILLKIYQIYETDSSFLSPYPKMVKRMEDEVKAMRNDLQRYGKFMIIPLYPRNLIKAIDEFWTSYGEFYSRFQKLIELAEKIGLRVQDSSSEELFHHLIGIEPFENYEPSDYNIAPGDVKVLHERALSALKDQQQLVEQMNTKLKQTRKMREQIFNRLGDFLKSNNLKLEPEPVPVYSPGPYH